MLLLCDNLISLKIRLNLFHFDIHGFPLLSGNSPASDLASLPRFGVVVGLDGGTFLCPLCAGNGPIGYAARFPSLTRHVLVSHFAGVPFGTRHDFLGVLLSLPGFCRYTNLVDCALYMDTHRRPWTLPMLAMLMGNVNEHYFAADLKRSMLI